MKIGLKKSMALLLALAMAFSAMCTSAFAVDTEASASEKDVNRTGDPAALAVIESGTCGDDLIWEIDDERVITITGSGPMYACEPGQQPWYSYTESLSGVVIDGATNVGAYAFAGFQQVKSVSLSYGITSLDEWAFATCKSLQEIVIPATVTTIGNYVFGNCTGLEKIIFTGDAPSMKSDTFGMAYGGAITTTAYYPEGNDTWTSDKLQNYGGTVTWIAYEAADKSELYAAMEEAESLDESEYTEASWSALQEALKAAEEIFDDWAATQSEVNTAADALNRTLDELTKDTDKTALEEGIARAEKLTESDYTAESWSALEEALNTAKETAADKRASQDQINTALADLEEAMASLEPAAEPEPPADTSELEATIAEAESLTKSDYTSESWANLDTALNAAKETLANEDATQEQVDAALADLEEAIASLEATVEPETPADAGELDAAVAEADKLNKSDYTAESWAVLEAALNAAKETVANGNATQEQVDAALADLEEAIASLKQAATGNQVVQTGFVMEDSEWHYYNSDGSRFTGSDIKQDTRKIIDGTDGWFYIENGRVNFDYAGVSNFSNAYGWWYVKEGKVDFGKTGIEQNNYGWWRVVNGQVDFGCNSVEQNDYGWWYLSGGKVDFSKNSVEQNQYGWWYILGGKVDFSYTGVANYANAYGWWYIKNGQVDFSKNSVEQNSYGWWYVIGGKVDFSYTGVADYANDYGWWYISAGRVDFSKTSVEPNSYGWWRVVSGKVDFSFTGRASNSYGTWYCVNGKVDFSRS